MPRPDRASLAARSSAPALLLTLSGLGFLGVAQPALAGLDAGSSTPPVAPTPADPNREGQEQPSSPENSPKTTDSLHRSDEEPDNSPPTPPTPAAPTAASSADSDPQDVDRLIEGLRRSARPSAGAPGAIVLPEPPAPPRGPFPGVISTKAAARLGKALPEGTFLVMERGTIRRSTDSKEWLFVPLGRDGKAAPRPLVLLPSRELEALEAAVAERGEDAEFVLSGQVFSAQKRSYLLPVAGPDRELALKRAEVASTNPDRGRRDLLTEGVYLVSRRGRVTRSDDGGWVFAMDVDPDGHQEPPMRLLPSSTTEAMTRVAERQGDGATLTVSGRVFAYRGRNYLLPSIFETNDADADLYPTQ